MPLDWRPFAYGGLASMIAECGTFPIDTTKTRLQIQGQKIDPSLTNCRYGGMFSAFIKIFREEGVRALYNGIAPALLRQATYGTIKIGVYDTLKRTIAPNPKDETLRVNVVCGVVAGIISSAIANPTDVLKVRMQAQSKNKEFLPRAFMNIYKKEGVRGMWRGVGPTSQRAAVVAGVELPVYDFTKRQIIEFGIGGDTRTTHFLSSATAGVMGAIASNPIDVVKTRMMNQRNLIKPTMIAGQESASAVQAIYSSSWHCVLQTVKTEGFMALYKGFIPNAARLVPWNIIFFMSREQLYKLY